MKSKTGGKTDNRSTIGGPSRPEGEPANDFTAKLAAAQDLAAAMAYNANKALEYGEVSGLPEKGQTVEPPNPSATGSTLTETMSSHKVGIGNTRPGFNPGNEPLDRVRVDSSDRTLTTNQGVPVADNQNSLKAGYRGPALLEDFILREKITHFDHERIPERIVHARGSAAHGYFECYEPLQHYTRASLFSAAGKRTPVFVRFSTVFGERGSADTARDARGFAVKFYTDEGNWDLVGNNIPVFFIQDAMKFPDLVHAAKPEPHFAMPQASTAHDTFWDFVSLMPESVHMLMWVMSDRAIPRSFRMMQGFGVHTFRLVTADGESRFVKFHWRPLAGTHSLEWDEAVKIAGADADFHRRDLWEAIECGAFPEYELGMQIFTEAQAEEFSFDVLDATKIIPEELVSVKPVGKLVLNRNPDNFFAETEQVAFCAAHIVPGLDFSSDPLLAGRIHSYVDTQISRLGGPNFHEIPINSPVAQVHNNQRDGMHRQAINRGRVAYEPNSLGGGCPFQAGAAGFTSFREPVAGDKVRGKPERFADHYTQATLFWNSQTAVEQEHIIRAFRFELTRVQTPAIRERTLAMLANVAQELAASIAEGLGMALPPAQPRAMQDPPVPEVASSPALSLFSRPGDGSIRMRRIAILVADGVSGKAAAALHAGLSREQAVPRFVGARLGTVRSADGDEIEADITFETMPSVLFDAVAVPGGHQESTALVHSGEAIEFIRDQYRHCKPILVLDGGISLIESADVKLTLPSGELDPGVLYFENVNDADILPQFIEAIAAHRHFEREIEPPRP
ncbi:catalase [Nitrosovibrio tenuis]|uniref:Catalase n=1 Tax=Nitrosovibrio tenuis TaxID=1233 RepID=A0A1H7IPI9_9PROT|nr:catalase [Nitrosovibrio tenuis]SEK62665.1 catalase [Nitrosovibrio tenuis]